MTEAGTSPSSPRKDLIQRDQCIFTSTTHLACLSAARKKRKSAYFCRIWCILSTKKPTYNLLLLLHLSTQGKILKISIFKEDLNNTSFYIYGYCSELYRMTFHEIYPKNHPFLCSGASRPQSELFFYCKQANLQKLKINFKSFTLLQHWY